MSNILLNISQFPIYLKNSIINVLVRLDDSVTRADLESINPDVDKLTTVKQTKVKVIIIFLQTFGLLLKAFYSFYCLTLLNLSI